MQEFLTNDTVSANLMSLTGYRVLVLLDLLLQGPCTIKNINDCFKQNKYIQDKFSNDTLRIYINSLRAIGCDITKATRANGYKYIMSSHPFYLKLSESNKKAIHKIYENIYTQLDIKALIDLENLFLKLASFSEGEDFEFFNNLSRLKLLNKELLLELEKLSIQKKQIKLLYNSPRIGASCLEFVCDRIGFQNSQLYIWGTNLKYGEYSCLNVERVEDILSVSLNSKPQVSPITIKIKYHDMVSELCACNKFSLMQEVLENQHVVIGPDNFKQEVLDELKKMRAYYE